ncbi:MAG: VOC family protein [Myxococcota bacterium]
MPTPPAGWPRISSVLFYEDAGAAIEWLEKAFGFTTRLKVEDGAGGIVHSELELGDGVVMVASAREARRSPRSLGGANTQALFVYVDDVDAHFARARAGGAQVVSEPSNRDYDEWEDRTYETLDCEGHRWWFGQRVRTR